MTSQSDDFTGMLPGDLQERVRTCMRLLMSPEVRLLTLTGPPGVGKTWLMDRSTQALGGTLFTRVERLELAELRNWLLFLPTLAERLGLANSEQTLWGIKESLLEHLRGETTLLLLDAFEDLLPAAPSLRELLDACPGLKILATSRLPLGLAIEQVFAVEPLSVPNLAEPSTWAQASSVDLFYKQGQTVAPGLLAAGEALNTVAQLCIQLDGFPLAILAAIQNLAQINLEALLTELSEPSYLKRWELKNLGRSPSLYAALKWSYQNLSQDEQTLITYASVFEDVVDVATLEKLVPSEGASSDVSSLLESLAAKQLVRTRFTKKGDLGVYLSYLTKDFLRLELAESGEDLRIKSAYAALKVVDIDVEAAASTLEKAVPDATSGPSTSFDVDGPEQANVQGLLEHSVPEFKPTDLSRFEDEAEILELVTEALTEREVDVLQFVARGLSNREVAAHLDISHRTVSTHLSNIYSKLNVHTRTAAARRARQLNLDIDV